MSRISTRIFKMFHFLGNNFNSISFKVAVSSCATFDRRAIVDISAHKP